MMVGKSIRNRLFLTAAVFLASALIVLSCSRGGGSNGGSGGGGTPPPPPPTFLTFATPQEAAGSISAALVTRSLAGAAITAAMELGLTGKLTAGIGSLYKPGLDLTNSAALRSLDPTLAGMADIVTMSRRSPVLKKVVQRTAAMAPLFSVQQTTSVDEVLTVGFCDNTDGRITIVGQNNYTDITSTTLDYTYDVKFTKCRDDITFSELNGTLRVVNSESIATSAFTSSLVASLTQKQYSAIDYATLTQQITMSGSFGNNDQITFGAKTADGAFAVTTPTLGNTPEKVVTYTFVVFSEAWTVTRNAGDGSDSRVDTITGQVVVTTAKGGVTTGRFNVALNLTDRLDTLNDVPGTKNQWLDGTIDTSWSPDLALSGCLSGRLSIATSPATPWTYTLATGYLCPVSGELKSNNATITYGPSIQLALTNNLKQTFVNCAALDQTGGVCAF